MTAPGSSPRSTPPPLAVTTGEWRSHAACHNHPSLPAVTWDDDPGVGRRETGDQRAQRTARARKVCRTQCPVREQCLGDVDLDYDTGIRGGEDLRDLRAARRRAKYAASA